MTATQTLGAACLALASATSFGLASALQHAQAGQVAQRSAFNPGLLGSLARRPQWLLGGAADILAVVLQGAALRYGAVALVQPVLVAGLPVAVLLSALYAVCRLHRREWVGLALCTTGLALLAPATATTPRGIPPSRVTALLAGLVLAALTGCLLLLARRVPRWSGAAAGSAAGIVIGAGSVLLAVCAERVGDLPALLASVAPYAAVAVGLAGLALSQAAFQTGGIGGPLAALSVVEPVVAVVLAVVVLHERLPSSGLALLGAVVGTVLAVAGVVALTRQGSPLVEPPGQDRE